MAPKYVPGSFCVSRIGNDSGWSLGKRLLFRKDILMPNGQELSAWTLQSKRHK